MQILVDESKISPTNGNTVCEYGEENAGLTEKKINCLYSLLCLSVAAFWAIRQSRQPNE